MTLKNVFHSSTGELVCSALSLMLRRYVCGSRSYAGLRAYVAWLSLGSVIIRIET